MAIFHLNSFFTPIILNEIIILNKRGISFSANRRKDIARHRISEDPRDHLEQWCSKLTEHQNLLEGLLNTAVKNFLLTPVPSCLLKAINLQIGPFFLYRFPPPTSSYRDLTLLLLFCKIPSIPPPFCFFSSTRKAPVKTVYLCFLELLTIFSWISIQFSSSPLT